MGNTNTMQRADSSEATAIGYNTFLRIYKQRHAEMKPNEVTVKAAIAWSELSDSQKERYARLASRSATSAKFRSARAQPKRMARSRKKQRPVRRAAKRRPKPRKKKKKPSSYKKRRPASRRRPIKRKSFVPRRLKLSECEVVKKKMRKYPVSGNAFINFMRKFRQKNWDHSPTRILKMGAKAWCKLDERQRLRYRTRHIEDGGRRSLNPTGSSVLAFLDHQQECHEADSVDRLLSVCEICSSVVIPLAITK